MSVNLLWITFLVCGTDFPKVCVLSTIQALFQLLLSNPSPIPLLKNWNRILCDSGTQTSKLGKCSEHGNKAHLTQLSAHRPQPHRGPWDCSTEARALRTRWWWPWTPTWPPYSAERSQFTTCLSLPHATAVESQLVLQVLAFSSLGIINKQTHNQKKKIEILFQDVF